VQISQAPTPGGSCRRRESHSSLEPVCLAAAPGLAPSCGLRAVSQPQGPQSRCTVLKTEVAASSGTDSGYLSHLKSTALAHGVLLLFASSLETVQHPMAQCAELLAHNVIFEQSKSPSNNA
jgi:hypothetical protein